MCLHKPFLLVDRSLHRLFHIYISKYYIRHRLQNKRKLNEMGKWEKHSFNIYDTEWIFFHFRMSMNMKIYRFGDTIATKAHIKLLNGLQHYVSFI